MVVLYPPRICRVDEVVIFVVVVAFIVVVVAIMSVVIVFVAVVTVSIDIVVITVIIVDSVGAVVASVIIVVLVLVVVVVVVYWVIVLVRWFAIVFVVVVKRIAVVFGVIVVFVLVRVVIVVVECVSSGGTRKIWGPDVPSLKGKTTRATPSTVTTDIVEVPVEIRELHRIVTLSIDVFYVNKIPFFITLSHKLMFTTVTHLANRKISTIFKALKSIFYYYLQKGFQILTIKADNEFAPLTEMLYELPGAPTLNLTSANEHEPNIERRIRVVKERTRAVRHSIPFTSIPVKMLTHMVFFVVKLLNYFPAKGGVSTHFSPKTIMSGQTLNYKQCSLPFGTYCQVHEEDGPRNSLIARTSGALSDRGSGGKMTIFSNGSYDQSEYPNPLIYTPLR